MAHDVTQVMHRKRERIKQLERIHAADEQRIRVLEEAVAHLRHELAEAKRGRP